jgi:hypothetical protein
MNRLIFASTDHGIRPTSPEDDPDMITCPVCGEDVREGEVCLECANGEHDDFK